MSPTRAVLSARFVIPLLGVALLAACGGKGNPTAPSPISAPATQVYIPGQTYFGRNNYVEYQAGALPVIISVPHGGSLAPAEIPDRTWGTTGNDTAALETGRAVAAALLARTGNPVHLIVCHLRRVKLDANRDVVEAAQGNVYAIQAWNEYHGFIEAARQAVTARSGRGLYIDLHGHGHAIPRLELGYLLTASDLDRPDAELNQGGWAANSSLRALAAETSVPFAELLRGPSSLGGLLQARGYPAVPSPATPTPGNDPYYSGGYSVQRHGSLQGGCISGVQIECHYPGVRDTAANRAAFASALADALSSYFGLHYRLSL